jgi:hypothetical protein
VLKVLSFGRVQEVMSNVRRNKFHYMWSVEGNKTHFELILITANIIIAHRNSFMSFAKCHGITSLCLCLPFSNVLTSCMIACFLTFRDDLRIYHTELLSQIMHNIVSGEWSGISEQAAAKGAKLSHFREWRRTHPHESEGIWELSQPAASN